MHVRLLRYAGANVTFDEFDKWLRAVSREVPRRTAAPSRFRPSEGPTSRWASPYHPRYAAFDDDIAHRFADNGYTNLRNREAAMLTKSHCQDLPVTDVGREYLINEMIDEEAK